MSQLTAWFRVTVATQAFTLPVTPIGQVNFFLNGQLTPPNTFSVIGPVVTTVIPIAIGDSVQIQYYPASPAPQPCGPVATNSIDLTSLAAVKNRAEVTSCSDDGEIQSAITGFSTWLTKWSGRSTLNSVESLTESYNGNGNSEIGLRSFPILSLNLVQVDGVSIPISGGYQSWGAFIEQNKKFVGLRGGMGGASAFPAVANWGWWGARGNLVFNIGLGNVTIGYTAGYEPATVSNEVDTITNQTIILQQGPWVSDGGVLYFPSLAPLENVPNTPSAGQYSVSNGLYVFNSADEGNQVAVIYTINQAPYDLEYATRCVVAINYKRKGWQDQASRATSTQGTATTTRYQNWDFSPEYWNIFCNYRRQSFI